MPYEASFDRLHHGPNWHVVPFLGFRSSGSSGVQQETELCAQCSSIDFEAVSRVNKARNQTSTHISPGKASTYDGELFCFFTGAEESMAEARCTFCRTVAYLMFSKPVRSQRQGASGRSGAMFALPLHCTGYVIGPADANSSQYENDIAIKVRFEKDHSDSASFVHHGFMLATKKLPKLSHGNTELKPRTVDAPRIRQMISGCEDYHTGCQHRDYTFPENAQVIDCNSLRLVPLTTGHKYFALSYIWGKQQYARVPDDSSRVGSIPTKLPRTIQDAITVTRAIGFGFLWVDRYCIDQHGSEDKKHQISQMANIYNHAEATLCALGPDDDAGLYGLSVKRTDWPSAIIQGVSYLACPAPEILQLRLRRSAWSTRGWTFQEAILSRRCIFFTPEQAVLICRCASQFEGTNSGGSNETIHLSPSLSNIFTTILTEELDKSLGDVRLSTEVYIRHYQRRHLTYDADALNAFRGILMTASFYSFYGVVIFEHSWKSVPFGRAQRFSRFYGLAHGLVWYIDRHLESGNNRRLALPSWSWVSRRHVLPVFPNQNMALRLGLSAPIVGLEARTDSTTDDMFVADIRIRLDSSGDCLTIRDILDSSEDAHKARVIPEMSHTLQIRSLLANFRVLLSRSDTPYGDCTFYPIHKGVSTILETFSFELSGDCFIYHDAQEDLAIVADEYDGKHVLRGLALLILVESRRRFKQGTRSEVCDISSFWHVVKEEQDGTYTRQGLIKARGIAPEYKVVELADDMITTVRLG